MSLLTLIKKRASVRKYQDKPIPKESLNKIIDAGIWGPAVPSFLGMQPWRFVVVVNKQKIRKFSEVLLREAYRSSIGVKILLSSASKVIGGANVVIAVYNSNELKGLEKKCKVLYSDYKAIIKEAEASAISASIQNMILVAEDLGIGSCWLDAPVFCRESIDKFLNARAGEDLFAVLSLGYPEQKAKRSVRKPRIESVEFII